MAPLPDNNTGVLFIDYTVGGQKHTAQIRLGVGSNTAEAVAAYNAMKPLMQPYLHTTDSITGGRWRAAGSNLAFPIAVTAAAGTWTGTPDPDTKPNFLSWTGRGSTGRRVRFTIFSQSIDLKNSGYRDVTLSGADLAVQEGLYNSPVGAVDISGMGVIWNNYVNFGANAYYQRKARRS